MEYIPEFSLASLVSFPIELIFSETSTSLASATAFFYRKDNSIFLITNWHNLTGLNPVSKKPLGKHAGRPDIIRYPLHQKIGDEFKFIYFESALYLDESMQEPFWLIHPKFKELVDVVALEINIPIGLNFISINDSELEFEEMQPKVADDVFILGYPYNIRHKGVLPIWKRASIATEPDLDYDDKPIILVDTATRSGMSGSPVILRRKGIYVDEKKDKFKSTKQCFLGIYSGRLVGETEFEAQLGIVWKKNTIEQIIEGRVRDKLR